MISADLNHHNNLRSLFIVSRRDDTGKLRLGSLGAHPKSPQRLAAFHFLSKGRYLAQQQWECRSGHAPVVIAL